MPAVEDDVCDFVRPGGNRLKVSVVNTWHNRLMADAQRPIRERLSHNTQPYRIKPGTPPASSGLLGSVRLVLEK